MIRMVSVCVMLSKVAKAYTVLPFWGNMLQDNAVLLGTQNNKDGFYLVHVTESGQGKQGRGNWSA